MSTLKNKAIKPQFPRDGEYDMIRPDTTYTEDKEYPGKFLLRANNRVLSLWESQLDQVVALVQDKAGVVRVNWVQEPNSKRVTATTQSKL